MELAIKTYDDIMACGPCYDPAERGLCTRDWRGTALDILRADTVTSEDKLWLVLRPGWIDDRTLRLFACWCARQALALIDDPDPRSVEAIDVAERYANSGADDDELAAAWDAARAAGAAARAAGAAAWAAGADAGDAAWDAAWDAARAAAWDAAWEKQVAELARRLFALVDGVPEDAEPVE